MRKLSVWILFAAVVATLVFAAMGDTVAFAVSAVALTFTGVAHWRWGCRRCTNFACALNSRSPEFVFGGRRRAGVCGESAVRVDDVEFSDIRSAVLGAPVLVAFAPAVYASWRFDPLVALACLGAMGVGFALYYRATCSQCTNDCPANHNPAYRCWKSSP